MAHLPVGLAGQAQRLQQGRRRPQSPRSRAIVRCARPTTTIASATRCAPLSNARTAITFATVDSTAAEAVEDAIGAASARSPEPRRALSSMLASRLQRGDSSDRTSARAVQLKRGTREQVSAVLGGTGPDRRVICGSARQDSQSSPDLYCHPQEVESRLSTSKPISWRGRGELPTYSWSALGTWLVIDLWSGIGGTLFACLALGIWVFAVAVEQDPMAAARAAQSFPNLFSVQYVEDFRGSMLNAFLKRRSVEGVIIGGGSPCQGNSSLNRHRRGLGDTRSHQPSAHSHCA